MTPADLGQGIATYQIDFNDPRYGAVSTTSNGVVQQFYVPTRDPSGFTSVSESSPITATFGDFTVANAPFSISAAAKLVPAPGSGQDTSVFDSVGVNFGFAINGPHPGQVVPVYVVASLNADGALDPSTVFNPTLLVGGIQATAVLSFYDSADYGNGLQGYYNFTTGATVASNHMPVAATIDLVEGDVYYVGESVLLQGAVSPDGSTISASAFADPSFSIPAAFVRANPGVSLQISPGLSSLITTAAPAPEPSSWALMLLGVGFGGAALRTRRNARPA